MIRRIREFFNRWFFGRGHSRRRPARYRGKERGRYENVEDSANVWILPSVTKTFISVVEMWLRTYLTDAVGSAVDYYARLDFDKGHIELLETRTERYGVSEKVE